MIYPAAWHEPMTAEQPGRPHICHDLMMPLHANSAGQHADPPEEWCRLGDSNT
jgi:hypothetical protein